jgi:hypothetical protein
MVGRSTASAMALAIRGAAVVANTFKGPARAAQPMELAVTV